MYRVRDLGLALILDTSGWAAVRSAQPRLLQYSARAGIPFVTGSGPHGPRNATAATTPKKCQIVDLRFVKSFLVASEDFHKIKAIIHTTRGFVKSNAPKLTLTATPPPLHEPQPTLTF